MRAEPDRKVVRRFFDFRLDRAETDARPLPWLAASGLAALAFIVATLLKGFGVGIAVGIVVESAMLGLFALLAWLKLRARQATERENHQNFAGLADQTHTLQAADLRKAFHRVLERASIDRARLVPLERSYVFSRERELFGADGLNAELGTLANRSIRLISRGSYANRASRQVRWPDGETEEVFVNPLRLVVLFLADGQLIICDVQIDSMDGDFREEFHRIPFSGVRSLHVVTERSRPPRTVEELVQQAEELGYCTDDIAEIRAESARGSDGLPDWGFAETSVTLNITRRDGGVLALPVRNPLLFGRHKAALDQDIALDDDDSTLDRMVAELGRLMQR